MSASFTGRDFLRLTDFSQVELLDLILLAIKLKRAKQQGKEKVYLEGKSLALIFEKASTRTRCAFEVAAYDQKAQVTYLEPKVTQIGHKESIKDTARVLGRMYSALAYRGASQSTLEELAHYSEVPVFNGLTDEEHPTQVLADLMTMIEYSGQKSYTDVAYAYVGDGRNNTANSLLYLGALMGMDVRICAPAALSPRGVLLDACQQVARRSGAKIKVTDSLDEGLAGVDFIYTDVWVSMGESAEAWAERVQMLKPYRVDHSLIDLAKNREVKFMHCLPACHNRETKLGEQIYQRFGLDGIEVTDAIFESPHSIVFDQAENRMHTIKALLVAFLSDWRND
ncbi:MAG: ornithine carbamoyltransferase [Neisseriaceae bacterium]